MSSLKYYQHTILFLFVFALSLLLASRYQTRYQIQMHFSMHPPGTLK